MCKLLKKSDMLSIIYETYKKFGFIDSELVVESIEQLMILQYALN